MQQQQGQFSVAALCRVLQVSRSGFYAWKRRVPGQREQQDKELQAKIHRSFQESKATYGSPRVLRDLRQEGIACGKHRVARLMKAAGLRAVPVRRFVLSTDSNHPLPVAPNLLNREFGASAPDRRWAADITYLWTGEGWLYLSVVLDLFSRKVVGWSMQTHLGKELVVDALSMALSQRSPDHGLLHHSDRGSQYASADFQEALSQAGIVCSMSWRGNCWDNAVVDGMHPYHRTAAQASSAGTMT